jgi:hypothetical protein
LPGRKEFAQLCFDTLDWSGQGTVVTGGGNDTGIAVIDKKNKNLLIAMLACDALNGWKPSK